MSKDGNTELEVFSKYTCFLTLSFTLKIIKRCNDQNHEKRHQNVPDRQKLSNSVKMKDIDDIFTPPSNSWDPTRVFDLIRWDPIHAIF